PLAQDGDVAAEDEAEPPERLVVLRQRGQSTRGGERPERAAGDLPTRVEQARVVELHESGVVVVREGARGTAGGRERDELRVRDSSPARLGQRALGDGRRKVARLAAKDDQEDVGHVEYRQDPDAVGINGI